MHGCFAPLRRQRGLVSHRPQQRAGCRLTDHPKFSAVSEIIYFSSLGNTVKSWKINVTKTSIYSIVDIPLYLQLAASRLSYSDSNATVEAWRQLGPTTCRPDQRTKSKCTAIAALLWHAQRLRNGMDRNNQPVRGTAFVPLLLYI